MIQVNQVQLIGHLGKDPEITTLENGSKLASFSLATSDSYVKKDGEKVTDTQWHRIKVWGNGASLAEKYLKKGSKVMIEGKINYGNYKDKDGQTRYSTDIMCRDMMFLDTKSKPELVPA